MRPDSLLRLWRYINHLLTYLLTDENVRRLEEIHSNEAASAAAATHHNITPVSRDDDGDDDAQVKTSTCDKGAISQSGVSSWTRDDITRWLADNQLLSLQNW